MFLAQTIIKTGPLVLNYYLTQALYAANFVLTLLTYECMMGKQSGSRSGAVYLCIHCLLLLTPVIYAADDINR